MKLNHIYKSIACGVLLAMTATSCDLDYNPVDTYSDVTEGVNKTDEKPIFNSVQDVETSMVTLHKKFRDRQEHWYVDKLLIGDAHSDNAYAGTTGAEVNAASISHKPRYSVPWSCSIWYAYGVTSRSSLPWAVTLPKTT